MLTAIRDFLVDPRVRDVNADSDDRVSVHNKVLSEKLLMRNVFLEFYKTCINSANKYFCSEGIEIEIGSGVSFFKKIHPKLVVTDVVPGPQVEMVLDAQDMKSISDNSVKAIYALNCFHHLERPRSFFRELQRVLLPSGGVVLIEPYYGFLARPFYRNLHASEHFNPDQKEWESVSNMGVMSNANQALSYVVFIRDQEKFKAEFPDLEIVTSYPLQNYLRYLLSGGLNFRQLVPDIFEPILKFLEFILKPVCSLIALHYVVVIRKRP